MLSDDKVKRKRYDCLIKEGVVEYPDDLNYNWDWVDQKIGLKAMHYRDDDMFWARGSRSSYEDAKKFYEAEEKWSWETDTTLQDLRDNPLLVLLISMAAVVFFIPRHAVDKVVKTLTSNSVDKKKMVDRSKSVNSGGKITHGGNESKRNRKIDLEKQKKAQEEAEMEEECGENERAELARGDLCALLQAHIADIVLETSAYRVTENNVNSNAYSIDWRSIGEEYKISNQDVVFVCDQISDIDLLNDYADNIVEAFPGDHTTENDRNSVEDSEQRTKRKEELRYHLKVILEHVISILHDRNIRKKKMADSLLKSKVKSSQDKVVITREWDAATISCLAKGVNKYQSHRKRWDLVTDYMNHILSPSEPFTKPECIQQAQTIQNIQKEKMQQKNNSSVKLDSRTPTLETMPLKQNSNISGIVSSDTDTNESSAVWSTEQQQQLGALLKSVFHYVCSL